MLCTIKNQKGFSAVEILLVLIFLSIIGFTGYYVYHSQKSNAQVSQTSSLTPGDTTKAPASKSDTKPIDTTSYLVVKEWGVKIPLSDGIKDAVYADTSRNGYNLMTLSTKTLMSISETCGPSDIGTGTIARQTVSEHDYNATQDNPLDNPVYDTKIGGYYFGFVHPQSACDGNSQTAQGMQSDDMMLFAKAFEQIQAI